MAYEEKLTFEALNVAYEFKYKDHFLVLAFLTKNGLNLKSAYGLRYP